MPHATAIASEGTKSNGAGDAGWRAGNRARDPNRSLALDMLRGIAILLVLGRHFVVAPENLGLLQPFAAGWTRIGWSGVDLFFVLSGYLVSGLIFAEYRKRGGVDLRRFVIRRGFKIWPAYLAYLGVLALWLAWQHRGELSVVGATLWPNLLHVQNYFHTPRLHTWSLAVEEHFYLAAAFAFYLLLGRRDGAARLRHLPAFIACCVVGLAVMRYAAFVHYGSEALNLYATHLRFDGLLIGTLLAYWKQFDPGKLAALARHPLKLIAGGIVLAAPTLILSPEATAWTASVGLTALYIGFALVLVGWLHVSVVHPWGGRVLASGPAALLGQVGFFSYSIYLWHVDLAQTPLRKLLALADLNLSSGTIWLLATSLYVVLAAASGALLARLVELPALALRDRLFPSLVRVGSDQRTTDPLAMGGMTVSRAETASRLGEVV